MKIDNCEVRSCPYCGSERVKVMAGNHSSWVFCYGCTAMGPTCDTAVEAIAKWNSVYPDMDADFAKDWLESLLKDQDKKVYHGSDIREIASRLLTLKREVELLTGRINTILAIGRPRE